MTVARRAACVRQEKTARQQQEISSQRLRELEAELANARAARAQVMAVPLDLSTPESAVGAMWQKGLQMAAEQVVADAEQALQNHRKPRWN